MQIRISLLQAMLSGMQTGNFEFDGESVRVECQTRKCYDKGNFTKNFKNNSQLFDAFEAYDSKNSLIKLSESGRVELGKLIEELSK
jgi:hypothetical protein